MLKVYSMLPRSCIGRRTQTMIDIAHTIVSVASDQRYEFNATNGAIDDYASSYLTSIMTGSTASPASWRDFSSIQENLLEWFIMVLEPQIMGQGPGRRRRRRRRRRKEEVIM